MRDTSCPEVTVSELKARNVETWVYFRVTVYRSFRFICYLIQYLRHFPLKKYE